MFISVYLPLNLNLDKAKPAAEEKTMEENTTDAVIMMLLNMYLVMGIPAVLEAFASFVKLSQVGLDTKNLGGKANSSSMGLKA
jgi:hypothetical protein